MKLRASFTGLVCLVGCAQASGERAAVAPAPAAPVSSPDAGEPIHAVARGNWAMVWSKVDIEHGEVLGAPGTVVRPALGAHRMVVEADKWPSATAGSPLIQTESPADPTEDPFGAPTLHAPQTSESFAVGDFGAFAIVEDEQPVEVTFRGERVLRVWWTNSSTVQSTRTVNGKTTQERGERSSVYLEAMAPGTAEIHVRVGARHYRVDVTVSR